MHRACRRNFLGAVGLRAWPAWSAVFARLAAAAGSSRKFTLDLRCGAIGVGADLRKSIEYAHQFGFESVEPPGVAGLAQAELDEVLAEMKAKNLVWGAAGLAVNFRGDEAAFQAGMKSFPQEAAGLRKAGITRMGTWLSPSSNELTYIANFASIMPGGSAKSARCLATTASASAWNTSGRSRLGPRAVTPSSTRWPKPRT